MPCSDEEKNAPDPAKDGILHKLMKSRTILVCDAIDQEVAERVISQLLVLDADSNERIKVIINSPGGHVDSGYAIHDIMRFIESPILCIGAGYVASIAVPILFGADHEKRFSLPNTRFLLHQPSGGAGGPAADIRIEAQEILKIRTKVNELIARETGQDAKKVRKDSDRNFWMSAEEAVDYGIIRKIITSTSEI